MTAPRRDVKSPPRSGRTPAPADGSITVRQFQAMPEEPAYRLELRRGLLVREPAPGTRHGRVQARLVHALWDYVERNSLGGVMVDAGFILRDNPATIRVPDLSFVTSARIPSSGYGSGMWRMAPDLAIEVLSPSNRPKAIAEKMEDYAEAGVREVWLIDPRKKYVRVECGGVARVLEGASTLDGGALLPGFSIGLIDLFAP